MKTFAALFFLQVAFLINLAHGQKKATIWNPNGSTPSSELLNSRWTISPKIFPYFPVINKLYGADDNELGLDHDSGLFLGIRADRYFPNGKSGYGFELDYFNREIIVRENTEFFFAEHSIGFTPYYAFKINKSKANKLEKNKHGFIELGVRTQYMFTNEAYYLDGDNSRNDFGISLLKRTRFYGYLGIGVLRDKFTANNRRVGLSTLSVGIYAPVFNQAYLFNEKKSNFSGQFQTFDNSRSTNVYLMVNYFENIDLKKNSFPNQYRMPLEHLDNKGDRLLPPVINWNDSRKTFNGNFFVHGNIQPGADSVFFKNSMGDSVNTDIRSSLHYSLGYSIHFLGNNASYYSKQSGRGVNIRGFRWDFFAGAGFTNANIKLSRDRAARIHAKSIDIHAGGKIGYFPPGIYLFGGYARRIYLEKELFMDMEVTDDFAFEYLRNNSYFFGLIFNNAFFIRVNSSKANIFNAGPGNVNFTFGFGL